MSRTEDYQVFLLTQLDAHRHVTHLIRTRWRHADPPPDQAEPLAADIAALGLEPLRASPPPGPEPDCPLGLAYVVIGAHFGAGMLRRQWLKAANPRLHHAGRYLNSPSARSYWPTLLRLLEAADTGDHARREAGRSAHYAFAAFAHALESAQLRRVDA